MASIDWLSYVEGRDQGGAERSWLRRREMLFSSYLERISRLLPSQTVRHAKCRQQDLTSDKDKVASYLLLTMKLYIAHRPSDWGVKNYRIQWDIGKDVNFHLLFVAKAKKSLWTKKAIENDIEIAAILSFLMFKWLNHCCSQRPDWLFIIILIVAYKVIYCLVCAII